VTFSSPIFLFLLLPGIFFGYLLTGRRFGNLYLLFVSIATYVIVDGKYVAILLTVTVINYALGILISRNLQTLSAKRYLFSAILLNIGILAWFKYSGILVSSLNIVLAQFHRPPLPLPNNHLPFGISFFIFQAIAYILDVYFEKSEAQKNPVSFALFMSFFPKIAAGPIIRYAEVEHELVDRKIQSDLLAQGITKFVAGLGKKVLLADTLAKTANLIFVIPGNEMPASVAWLGIVCFTLQIYYDFSGYSDMAIGLANMFGFRFNENFNYPYISRSLSEFWRRWHISLSTWFRDYLFTPLNYRLITDRIRAKMARGEYKVNSSAMLSLLIVFALCGLWHGLGLNYLVWGMLHGLILAVELQWLGKITKKWWPPFQHLYLLFIVVITWVFFRAPGLSEALLYLKALAGLSEASDKLYHLSMYMNGEVCIVIAAAAVCAIPMKQMVYQLLDDHDARWIVPVLQITGLIIIMTVSCAALAKSTYSPFIYQKY